MVVAEAAALLVVWLHECCMAMPYFSLRRALIYAGKHGCRLATAARCVSHPLAVG
jgi:hypothetical protein